MLFFTTLFSRKLEVTGLFTSPPFQISNPSLSERCISNFAHPDIHILYFFLKISNLRFQIHPCPLEFLCRDGSSPVSSPVDLPPPDAATAAWRWPAHPGREVQNGTPTERQRPSKSLCLTSTTSPKGEALARQSSEVNTKLVNFCSGFLLKISFKTEIITKK